MRVMAQQIPDHFVEALGLLFDLYQQVFLRLSAEFVAIIDQASGRAEYRR